MKHKSIPDLHNAARTERGHISYRQFFFNEAGPAKAFNVHYAYAPVEKIDCTFEDDPEGVFSTTIYEIALTDDGHYRAFGSSRPTGENIHGVRVWESENGVNWRPLRLGQVGDTNLIHFENLPGDQTHINWPQVLRLRDGRWRMYFWKHRDGHLRFSIADSNDGLRWAVTDFDKPALFHPKDGGLWKLAEGLSHDASVEIDLPPEEAIARKRIWSNDAANVRYNAHMDRYECYSVWLHHALADRRVDVDNAPFVHRLIQRRISADGISFSDPELVVMPDDRDPWDLQFYFLAPHWFEDFMVGCLGHYRVEDGQQTMDAELCFSRDGVTWQRPLRGAWIPRSPEGSGKLDTKGIYAFNPWLDRGDKWLAVYLATPNPHNRGDYPSGTMAASFPKNRFIGVEAGSVTGGFLSEPFFPAAGEVKLDATIIGWLRAELCDAFGRKLPGFHLNDSVPVTGDSEAHTLKWKNASVADHLHECLRLRFEYQEGVIYNFSF